ncbi:MAG TPA: CDP-diacylglycerol--serine O-phosphatidyltransferase [Patescibacteria group bacterium]|nr:CDP-diacylglycerol--serine O-phosphatidyltransferase [Patescibacteria group bacterium]
MSKKWIPNTLTILSLFAGIGAMLLALSEQWLAAVGLIFGAAMFDSLDGRVARRLNVANEFGRELDSLADLVSFGVAPATVFYLLLLTDQGWSGALLTTLFPVCGALRLARFNVANVKNYYVGVPITVAGPLLAGIALFGRSALPLTVQQIILLLLAGLMVSTFRVPKL